ncbi:MAG: transporter [Gammaproteobacteria bacterium]|nr:MAG: transporter [Gammaproteobacteria bacterium]
MYSMSGLGKHSESLTTRIAQNYALFVVRWRKLIIFLIALATVAAFTQIDKIDIRNDPDTLLPKYNHHVLTNAFVEENFGMGNLMVIGLEVNEGDIYQPWFINKVISIHKQLEKLPSARPYNYISIAAKKVRYIKGSDYGLDIKHLLPRAGIDEKDEKTAQAIIDDLRVGLEENPVIRDMLLSKDKRSTFIITDFDESVKAQYLKFIQQVKTIIEKEDADPRINIYAAGEPYFLAYMLLELKNHWYLFVISILLVAMILMLESWNLRITLLPLIGVGASVVLTLGLMGFTQYKLTTMMILTPVLVFAIGIGHSIQVIRQYIEELSQGLEQKTAATNAIAQTIIPATMAIITDVIGFLVLSTADISFYRAYALFGLFGMFTLLLTCTTLVPLMATFFNIPANVSQAGIYRWERRLGNWLTNIITGPMKWVPIAGVLILITTSVAFIPKIELGINYAEAAFKKETKIIDDLHALNKRMPGAISFNIPFIGKEEGTMHNVQLLRGINQMEHALREDPAIGFTTSLAQYIQLLNWKMYGEAEEMWVIPYDQELVEQYLFTYSMGGDPEDLSIVTDYDYTNGQLLGFINTMDPKELKRVTDKITDFIHLYQFNERFANVEIGIPDINTGISGIGGFAGTSEATREVSEREWIRIPLTTAALVGIIIAILFRSLAMAGLLMIMIVITLLSQYGLAGYLSSIENWAGNLHFGNLVTLSIGMGLGVDYSIYLASRIKLEYSKSEDLLRAFRETFSTTGASALLSVTVLLFSLIPLLMTPLANTWGLAVFTGTAIIVSVLTAMTLLPILIRVTINLPVTLIESSDLLNLQVTERTLQLRKEKEELNNALQLLKQTQEQLVESEKMASLGGLVAGVAHEINTPLSNAVVASTHLQEEVAIIQDAIVNGEVTRSQLDDFLSSTDKACTLLYNNLTRAANLVQSFKQVAVDQSSQQKRLFDVKIYTEEVLLSIQPKFKKTHIKIDLNCEKDLKLEADPGSYAQVLSNLLMNSLLHAYDNDDEGIIQININRMPERNQDDKERELSSLRIVYSDDGKGMQEETLNHIFEPFYTTRRNTGGSGLGMHIVYNLVTQTLKGKITAQSEPGKGSQFLIDIPGCCKIGRNYKM